MRRCYACSESGRKPSKPRKSRKRRSDLNLKGPVEFGRDITFGQYAGTPWHDVPLHYLLWLSRQHPPNPRTRRAVVEIKRRREHAKRKPRHSQEPLERKGTAGGMTSRYGVHGSSHR